ncbi:DUF3072 domain-containing protein, partial [Salmonella enterica]|uniref:DUF3072 domain-containing protein n=1 Tax=Salmonella enterica TaxID=28901 RepID=UPI001A7F0D02
AETCIAANEQTGNAGQCRALTNRRRAKETNMADNTQKNPRDWASGDDPMTGAQQSYLKTLTGQAHTDPPAQALTKAEASELIDDIKRDAGLEPRPTHRADRR